MADEAKLFSPIHSTFEALGLCDVQLGAAMENWALSIDQCQLQALHFSVYHTNLLSILLRCIGFAEIQKAVLVRTGSRHQTVTMSFFWCSFGFWKCFGAYSWSSH